MRRREGGRTGAVLRTDRMSPAASFHSAGKGTPAGLRRGSWRRTLLPVQPRQAQLGARRVRRDIGGGPVCHPLNGTLHQLDRHRAPDNVGEGRCRVAYPVATSLSRPAVR